MGKIIEYEKIYFSFDKKAPLFKNVSFYINNGDIVSIIGNSGCGKSTFLNLIARLLTPESGQILFKGDNLVYLTQNITLLNYRTAFENSLLGLELRGMLSDDKIEKISELFIEFGLGNYMFDKYPSELSGGMKQRVGLIQSIIIDASLYLFDEPFNAIDRKTLLKIEENIWNRIRSNDSSAIFVTHDLEQAILMSDKIFIMPNTVEKKMIEIHFDDIFISQPPSQRRESDFFNTYLVDLVKGLSRA